MVKDINKSSAIAQHNIEKEINRVEKRNLANEERQTATRDTQEVQLVH